ncbi:hypothetical protein C1H76_8908 [Elsinoe australis]|uniref:Uncharacterized protein n=1 Tax=Elsinoe australis TaxID=40998 RepID=A0A4U7ALV2_9PEZI|nr:hypothetical protein C1H76_8908 [Elsinoe australis]
MDFPEELTSVGREEADSMSQVTAALDEGDLDNKQAKRLEAENNAVDNRMQGLQDIITELNVKITEKDNSISKLQADKAELNDKADSLEGQIQSLQRENIQLNNHLTAATKMTNDAKKKLEDEQTLAEEELAKEKTKYEDLLDNYGIQVSEVSLLRSEFVKTKQANSEALRTNSIAWLELIMLSVRSFKSYLNIPMETFGPVFDLQLFDTRSGNVIVREVGPSISKSLASQWVGYGLEHLETPKEGTEAGASRSGLGAISEVAQPPDAAGKHNPGEPESTQNIAMAEDEEHVFSSESSSKSDDAQQKSAEPQAIEEAKLIQEAMSQPDIGVEICELLELFWAELPADVVVMMFAQLNMRLAPERNQQAAWLKLSSALTKFHLIYQSVLQSRDLGSPEVFWVGISLLLSVHSMARFENDKAWIAYLDLYLSKQDFDSMGSFSKACLALLVTTTCEREDSAQLLPSAIYDEVLNLNTTDILSIYRHLRQSDQDGDFFEQTLGEKTFSVVVSDGAKIVLVKQRGAEGYTALLGDPKVTVELRTWSFSWSKEYTMKYNNNMHLGDAPGLSEMSTIFRDAYGKGTYTPRPSKVPEIMKRLAELEEWTKDVE